jgi:outer membrane protein assembly factor BamB
MRRLPDCAELQLFAQLTGSYMDGSPVVATGVVYAGSADGNAYAFGLK